MIEPRIRFTVADLREALRVPDEAPDDVIVEAIKGTLRFDDWTLGKASSALTVEFAQAQGLTCAEVATIASHIFKRAVSEIEVVEWTHRTAWNFGRAYFWAVQKTLVTEFGFYAEDALAIVVQVGPSNAIRAVEWAKNEAEKISRDILVPLFGGLSLCENMSVERIKNAFVELRIDPPDIHSDVALRKFLGGAMIALCAPRRVAVQDAVCA